METDVEQDEQDAPKLPDIPQVFQISGRTFRRVADERSVDQDAYVARRLRNPRVAAVMSRFDVDNETIRSLTEEVTWEAFESGVIYEILGGALIEDGVPWTRESAARTASLIKNNTDLGVRAVIFALAADIIIDFFRVAGIWSPITRKSDPTATDNKPPDGRASDRAAVPNRDANSEA